MKALTLHQPYASAIALGHKHFETRSWATKYRGEIAIHAAKSIPAYAMEFASTERTLGRLPERLPLMSIVAVANLVAVHPTYPKREEVGAIERLYGDWSTGRFAWEISDVRALPEPYQIRGAQGLWNVTDADAHAILISLMPFPNNEDVRLWLEERNLRLLKGMRGH